MDEVEVEIRRRSHACCIDHLKSNGRSFARQQPERQLEHPLQDEDEDCYIHIHTCTVTMSLNIDSTMIMINN